MSSREGVTMCDYSSFAKFDIWSAGTEAVEFLQYMCSNDVDVPVGSIVHTGMHNKFGGETRRLFPHFYLSDHNFLKKNPCFHFSGYENDCSVARLGFNRFMLMSPSIQQMRSFTWMKHNLPTDGSVFLQVQIPTG